METLNEHRFPHTKAKFTKPKTSKSEKSWHSRSSNAFVMSSLAQRKRAKSKIYLAWKHTSIYKQKALLEKQTLVRQTEMKAEIEQQAMRAEQEAMRAEQETTQTEQESLIGARGCACKTGQVELQVNVKLFEA